MTYREMLAGLAAHDDGAFAEYVTGLPFPPHLREACRFAAASPRAAVLLPRGHAKTAGAIAHVARAVGASRGALRVGIVAATEPEAAARSRAVRDLVAAPAFADVFPWARRGLAGRPWRQGAWSVGAAAGGSKDATVRAASLLGLRPGARLDLAVCDDVVGPADAATAAGRAKSLDRFLSVLEPMLAPGGRVLVLGTRWHEDDLYAQLAGRGWPVLRRPALGEGGEALWPEVWPAAALAARREALGSAVFDLQFQNDPSGMGGNVFRREWLRPADRAPAGRRRLGLDLAITAGERSDYTAAVEVVEGPDGALCVVGAWRARLDAGHRAWLTGTGGGGARAPGAEAGPRLGWPSDRLPAGFAGLGAPGPAPRPLEAVNVESTAFQATVTRELLRETRLPARAVYPDRDKVSRARALAARYEGGRVSHLRGAPGIGLLEAELAAFPNGEHDDLVDALVYAADLAAVDFSFGSAAWR